MRAIASVFPLLLFLFMMSSCASIVSKSRYLVTIDTVPSESGITITDVDGVEVFNGTTPTKIRLKSGKGYFKKNSYLVTFEKDGYEKRTVPIESSLDGWYWGNIVFGGVIGWLIVDPLSGAMYKLDTTFISETLTKSSDSAQVNELNIYSIEHIPDSWKDHLVRVNE
jgi:hypothetical protein